MNTVSPQALATAKQIGEEINATFNSFSSENNNNQDIIELAPISFKNRLKNHDISKLRQDITQQLALQKADSPLLGGAFACSACTVLVYAGIVAALGATIILSGGMSIPAVLAASGYSASGLAVVLSAMTGVSTGAIVAMLNIGGTTLGVLVVGLCEAMGNC